MLCWSLLCCLPCSQWCTPGRTDDPCHIWSAQSPATDTKYNARRVSVSQLLCVAFATQNPSPSVSPRRWRLGWLCCSWSVSTSKPRLIFIYSFDVDHSTISFTASRTLQWHIHDQLWGVRVFHQLISGSWCITCFLNLKVVNSLISARHQLTSHSDGHKATRPVTKTYHIQWCPRIHLFTSINKIDLHRR